MFRLLLSLLGVALILWLWRQLFKFPPLPWDRSKRPETGGIPEPMVRCAHCGTYVPRSDAVRDGDATYCSSEHRRLGRPSDH
jgi:uncharacterized protein